MRMRVCVYIHTYIYIHTHTHTYIHTYVHTYTDEPSDGDFCVKMHYLRDFAYHTYTHMSMTETRAPSLPHWAMDALHKYRTATSDGAKIWFARVYQRPNGGDYIWGQPWYQGIGVLWDMSYIYRNEVRVCVCVYACLYVCVCVNVCVCAERYVLHPQK
jgi:hypothetical protein